MFGIVIKDDRLPIFIKVTVHPWRCLESKWLSASSFDFSQYQKTIQTLALRSHKKFDYSKFLLYIYMERNTGQNCYWIVCRGALRPAVVQGVVKTFCLLTKMDYNVTHDQVISMR